ncbi:MAG: DUF1508 domain-containing protein [Clostridia bacterium]|nr:DUF1508 domain-containing protein [Clostridia bacterium]
MELIKKTVEFCKDNLLMTAITAGAVLLTLLALIIALILSGKAKKAKKRAMQEIKETTPPVTETANTATPPATELKKEETAEPVELVESVKPAPQKEEQLTPVAEVKAEETVAVAEKTIEKRTENPSAQENKPKAKPTVQESKASGSANAVKTEKIENAPTVSAIKKENAAKENVRYKGKWVICRLITDEDDGEETYFFELHASNGEVLLSSEEYTSYSGVIRGIETHKTNIARDNFKITVSKKGDYIFKLMSGKNLLLCTGANYSTRLRCESAVASVKRFAETAVLDESVQEQYIKTPKDDNSLPPTLAEGCVGKWIIDTMQDDRGETIYYFELFANNGEKLLSSEEYTTYIGAVNGIQTHKKNIASGNFRITLTKRGDYIYKLLNGNGQLLCLGEHYKTKRLCQNAVESVKRFGLNSPTLTAQSNLQ